jgi:peptidyl-prolyl cis-trans isomerase D
MLKVFRNKNVTKVVLWGILILILPAFVMWGSGSLGGSKNKGPTYAGKIDGRKISFETFGQSITGVKCQVILNFYSQPKMLDEILNNKELVGKMAWDRLIMGREAKKAGVKVPNDEIVKFITTHPIFIRNGQFDTRVYDYVLQRVPIDPRSFEEIIRESIAIQKLNDSLAKGITVTDEEAFEVYRKENEKIKLSYVVFAADSFAEKATVDDAKMKEYYDANAVEFTIPSKVLEDGTVSEGGVAKFEDVKDNIKGFLAAVEARKLALKAAEEEHAKIKDLMAKDKVTFEQAIETEKLKKAETVFFARNEYIDGIGEAFPLTDAAVKLKPGEISAPVETRKGAVIFTVAEVQKSDEEKFKKEKEDYSKKIVSSKKINILEKWLRQLELTNPAIIDFRDYEKYYR